MRAIEFIKVNENTGRRIIVPTDPRTIELKKNQYELGEKWAAYQAKLADLRTKLNDASDNSSKTVANMAKHALAGRRNGVYGLSGDNAE